MHRCLSMYLHLKKVLNIEAIMLSPFLVLYIAILMAYRIHKFFFLDFLEFLLIATCLLTLFFFLVVVFHVSFWDQ